MSQPQESFAVRVQRALPAKTMGRIVRWLSRSENVLLKKILIHSFIRLYNVNLSEALNPDPDSYRSFNDFFIRELKPGARVIDDSADSVCSPADGTFAEFGTIRGSQMLQAKGIHYTLEQLFGGAEMAAQQFANGVFSTIYLAPYNYHRIHMPMNGRLIKSIHIPGNLLSVNAATTAQCPGLYATNERLIQIFSGDKGPFALVMVGALNVGSITTNWGGEIPGHVRELGHHYLHTKENAGKIEYKKGDYIGHFNLGSTVILVAGPEQGISWVDYFHPGDTVQMGELIARHSQ